MACFCHKNGIKIALYFCEGFNGIAKSRDRLQNARINLTEEPFFVDEEKRIREIYEDLDDDVGFNSSLIEQIGSCRDMIEHYYDFS